MLSSNPNNNNTDTPNTSNENADELSSTLLLNKQNKLDLEFDTKNKTVADFKEEQNFLSSSQSEIEEDIVDEKFVRRQSETDDSNNTKVKNLYEQFIEKMIDIQNYHREIICLLALILTTYATYQNHRAPSYPQMAKPIFNSNSFIEEFPQGQLAAVQARVSNSELSIILFYAPWCAQSLYARDRFEHLAKFYHKQFYFAAVNCWQPGGECRIQHNKIKTWPILVVYYPKSVIVQFNGPWQYGPMHKFLNSTLNPIKRVSSKAELNVILKHHSVVVIGFFRSIESRYYSFHRAAIKFLEHDPFQNTVFLVVTGKNLDDFGIKNNTEIQILNINGNISNFTKSLWNIKSILGWVKKEIKLLPKFWYNLNGNINQSLGELLIEKSPILILFTKRDWLRDEQDANKIIYEIVSKKKMHNINSDDLQTTTTHLYDVSGNNLTHKTDDNPILTPKVPLYIPIKHNLSYILLDILMFYNFAKKLGISNSYIQQQSSVLLILDNDKESIFMHKEPITNHSVQNFIQNYESNNLTRNIRLKNFRKTFENNDWLFKSEFVQHEENAISKGPRDNLIENADNLEDSLNKEKLLRLKQHNLQNENVINSFNDNKKSVKIEEIDGRQFHRITKRNNKITTLVLISSNSCSLCTLLLINLLKLLNIFTQLRLIEIYKIDGIENDLNWEYTMGQYPTLLIFSSSNDNEPRVFSQNLVPNEKNLFGFILANLNSSTDRLIALINYCQQMKISLEYENCLKISRNLIIAIIADNLAEYRKHLLSELCLMENLNNLRNLYFNLVDAKQVRNIKDIFIIFMKNQNKLKNFNCSANIITTPMTTTSKSIKIKL